MLLSEAAPPAAAATPAAVDKNGLAERHPRGALTELDHGARYLMAEREWQPERQRALRVAHDVQIRVAQSRAAHLKQQLTGPWLRPGDVAQLCRMLPGGQLNRPHELRITSN